ncbi:MAG: hypothetical protein DHS20C16_33940 [Phycisphaerae bacterium]|nr:MAG: hypothetical protein DHS20C16_33940 [Phycisphaerae bacterium]
MREQSDTDDLRPAESTRPVLSTRRKILYGFAVAVAAFVLLECAARLTLLIVFPKSAPIEVAWKDAPEDTSSQRNRIYSPDRELLFRLRPNIQIPEKINDRIFDVHTNDLGLRNGKVTVDKPAGVYRVLCIGDSTTFGSGAGDKETYPARLQYWLEKRYPDQKFEVLNAGVPGYSSYQARKYLEHAGFGLSPDAVVFIAGFNDTAPARPGTKRLFREGVELSDRQYAESQHRKMGLGIVLLAHRLLSSRAESKSTGDTAGDRIKRRVSLGEYQENLVWVIETCRARRVLGMTVSWPIIQDKNADIRVKSVYAYQRAANQLAREQESVHLDLSHLGTSDPKLFIDMVHLNPKGYDIVAKGIATELVKQMESTMLGK